MKYIYILFIAFFVGACNHVEKYSISGTWEGADGQIVCLLDGWGEDARVVDSAVVPSDSGGSGVLCPPQAVRVRSSRSPSSNFFIGVALLY